MGYKIEKETNPNFIIWDKLEKDEVFKEETVTKIINLVKKDLLIDKYNLYHQLDEEFWKEHSELDKQNTLPRMCGGFPGYLLNIINDLLIEGVLLLYDENVKRVREIGGYRSVYWKDQWEEYPDNYFNIMHYDTSIKGYFGIPHSSYMLQLTMGKIIGRTGRFIARDFAKRYHFYKHCI